MSAQETIEQAETICKVVDSFKGVISGQEFEIDKDIFEFTYYSSRGNRNAQTDKEYIFNGWTLFVEIQSGASVKDGDVTIHSNEIYSLDLYDQNGQEQPLIVSQQRELETSILKTIRQ